MREKAQQSLAFSPVSKPHTHITYMLRQCTSIVYIFLSQWLTEGQRFPAGTLVSSTNKTGRHHIAEILLKVALSTITLTRTPYIFMGKECYSYFKIAFHLLKNVIYFNTQMFLINSNCIKGNSWSRFAVCAIVLIWSVINVITHDRIFDWQVRIGNMVIQKMVALVNLELFSS